MKATKHEDADPPVKPSDNATPPPTMQKRQGVSQLRKPPLQIWQQGSDGGTFLIWSMVGIVVALLLTMILSWQDVLKHWRTWDRGATAESAPLHAPPPRRLADDAASTEAGGRQGTREKDEPQSFCYTLEMYSAKFIAPVPGRQPTPQHFFYRCGTRLVDMRTEVNRSKLDRCAAATAKSPTVFPTLRVFLASTFEERAHLQQQRNVAAQVIPLARVNDDYCDCLDGTDELQTNACSMSGAVLPLAHLRWKQYLHANAHVQLYEEEEVPSVHRTARLLRRLGGPVLPFCCRSDPEVWLAPSRVGDGVVDCCDGSDEVDPPPSHDDAQNAAAAEDEDEGVVERWLSRVAAIELHLDKGVGATSPLHPTPDGVPRTVAGMLLENGLTSLMSCRRLREERLRSARALYAVVERGHATYKVRKANGWEQYGKALVERSIKHQKELRATAEKFEKRRNRLREFIKATGKSDPFSAGVPSEELQMMEEMYAELQRRSMQQKHMEVTLFFRWLGDDFEYYPLADAKFRVPLNRVVDTAQSSSQLVRRSKASRRYNASYMFDAPPAHVDDTSYLEFFFVPYRYLTGVQNLTAEQKRIFLPHAHAPAGNNESRNASDADDAAIGPQVIFGFWRPDYTEVAVDSFGSIDPSGNGVLRWRLFVADPAPVMGGVEQTLQHERFSYSRAQRRVLRLENPNMLEQMKNALEGTSDTTTIEMPQQQNKPELASVQIFYGGIPCAHDDAVAGSIQVGELKEEEGQRNQPRSYGRVVYVCAEEDGVLEWHRNGKCAHEVAFGTPSACMSWVLKAAAARVQQAERALHDELL
ncbi:hypothetical protein TraAM80_02222 [Trypanosoma rangeli]|uniref:Glucosidase II beta subunit-like protein n=1 Tax=Trypanosoma rangeli TaxID=5698 RepID=A0A422NV59_TRYRA|nr:uncharacterized protein TraAM80_02222 [Trypanosoma rangeli]RNF09348.1 hypothetical protein TraAM80_02222 [Trypanosoma rangeli]|eukprot:RNF09348.1 hypothetical protein TraAM80_02222 [Trypanosoma rangeli]